MERPADDTAPFSALAFKIMTDPHVGKLTYLRVYSGTLPSGSQILNVGLGGDLVQHLPDVVGHDEHKHTPGEYADHDVTLERGTRLGALLGDHAPVKSHHHQGFGRIGLGLREAAHAEDGTVEALEDPARRFALGVLWHPEAGADTRLFEAFIEEARRYRRERRASSSS